MNCRQRKKKLKKHEVTIIVRSVYMHKAEDYEKMRRSIEYQLRAGSVIVLPAYLRLEAIIQQDGSRRIEVRQETKDNERSGRK